ncbi:MAG: GTP-binding protein [Clostridia bacterium]|nr:GTP-binding protein [Clostridia bacterium]
MAKIDIVSGFLGAGKTTLIKKLIKEAFVGEKLVLIENEFGEIGVDGAFLAEAGVKINELNSGCICCSLVGDFSKALKEVYETYRPDRIIIEPSGVGKLSDVIRAVESAGLPDCKINSYTAVVDAAKCKMYMKNFGEFFNDQIETAACIVFSHVDKVSADKLDEAVKLVKKRSSCEAVVTTPWDVLDGKKILAAMEAGHTLGNDIEQLIEEEKHCHHDHEHHHHDGECCHHDHEHHRHDGECCHHDHEHHHHDGECCHHDHEHHHHDGECCHHDHEHHHHADEVFASWGVETGKKFTEGGLKEMLSRLSDIESFGMVLRAKGVVPAENGWLHFDYIPGEINVRPGAAACAGRLCVIGSKIDGGKLEELFGV